MNRDNRSILLSKVLLTGLLLGSNVALADVDGVQDGYSVEGGEELSVAAPGVLGNDLLVGGSTGPLRVIAFDQPNDGSVNVLPDGSFVYRPDAGFVLAEDRFRYTVEDSSDGRTDVVEVIIQVTAALNDAPVANAQVVNTLEDTAATITLTGSDVDVGDTLTYDVDSGPTNGTLTGTAPSLTYTPAADYNGPDSFTFTVSDGTATSAAATVSITVAASNDAPVANAQVVNTLEDTAASITLTGSDVDVGDTLTYNVASGPTNGTLTGTAPSLTYTPAADYNGPDNFTFTVSDGTATSAAATVSITVAPVNDLPVATAVLVTTDEDTAAPILLTATDIDGDALTFNVTDPGQGTLTGTAPNLTYTPDADYHGPDSFTFTVNDGTATSVAAPVTITVNPVNDLPVADASSVTTAEDTAAPITLTGSDTEGSALSFDVTDPAHGALSGTAPNLTYTPDADYHGPDSFTFTVNDGTATSVAATVSITVTPVNDAPVTANQTLTTPEDTALAIVLVVTDVDGDALTFSVTDPTQGTLVGAAPNLTYTPAADYNGPDSFTFTVSDGVVSTPVTTVSIDVTPVNDQPQAGDDAITVAENSGATAIAVLANDYLADAPSVISRVGVDGYSESAPVTILDSLGAPIVWQPDGSNQNGRVTVEGDQVIYEPKPHYHGTDTFTYEIRDANGDTATATVTVTVTAVNSVPVGPQERAFSLQEGGSLTVDATNGLLVTAYDPDNAVVGSDGETTVVQPLSMLTLTVPAVGLLEIDNATGTFTYTPPTNFVGEVSFSYVLTDGLSLSAPASNVRIVVFAGAPPPTPPTPGQVAIPFNLSNVPLEQSAGVPPNVLVVMDDSFSMDYQVVVPDGADESLMLLDNSGIRRRPVAQAYGYLWNLPSNTMQPTSSAGAILPTEEALEATSGFDDNEYGVWRVRNHQFNTLYYNPATRYTPWTGSDLGNQAFTDANPAAVRLNPVDPTRTFNILNNHSYVAGSVPRWSAGGSASANVDVSVYIPHYYTTAVQAPLEWNDPYLRVDILPSGGPYAGSSERADCAVGDGDPLTCTYDQEIRNFANWFQYYRSREFVTKASMGKVVAQVQDVRVGYLTTSNPTSEDIREMNDLYTTGNKKLLLDNIYSVTSNSQGSPQRQLLDRAGAIFACEFGSYCPRLPAPAGFCQQNFALLMTDGYWSQGTGVASNADADTPNPFDGGRYADSYSSTLADTAMYHYKRDLHPDFDDLVPVGRRDVLGAPDGTFDPDQPFMQQHMKTYSIAFGVKGTIEEGALPIDPTEAFAWPDPWEAPAYKIDDVLHAAVNGRGQYLNASNPQQLQAALESAFLEFTQAASSTSSAAFNSTSLEEGTLIYRGFYDLRYNIGELTATRVQPNGDLAPEPLWRASEELDIKSPLDRVIVTYDPLAADGIPFRWDSLTPEQEMTLNESQVDFLRGTRSAESPAGALRAREASGGLLGDIVNSSPVFVGPPRSVNRDQSPFPVDDLYSAFAVGRASRTPLVYVGANDGMLHGFEATDGEELFAYVPNKLIDGTLGYRSELSHFTSPFYQHRYFVDLTPRFNDVYIRTPLSPTDKHWRTVLVGGLGAGGKGFYALDVTDPSLYATESSARDTVLWEFTDENDTYPVGALGVPLGGSVGAITDPLGRPVKDLGYSISLPTIAMSNVSSPSSVEKEWVAVFGNGPNSTAGIAKLFVLFMDRGLDGWSDGDFVKIDTGFGVPVLPHPLTGFPNGLGTPSAVDSDLNGTVDVVYAGDRLGNLFRFDLGDPDPANWSSTRIFTASYSEGGVNTIQPILSQPLVIKHPTEQGFLVIFGTGSYVTRDDARNEDIQSIYAIWDRGENNPATAAADSRERRLVEQDLTNVFDDTANPQVTRRVFLNTDTVEYRAQNCSTADCSAVGDSAGQYGWFVDLDLPRATQSVSGGPVADTSGRPPPGPQYPGERAIRRLLVRNGNIVTTTVLPALDEFSCFGTRPGAILVLSALTGGDIEEPLIDFNNDGYIDGRDLLNLDDEYYSGGLLLNQTDLDGQLVDLSTLGGAGGTDYLFVSGGRDTIAYLIEGVDDRRTGRLSWRELDFAN